MLPVVQFFLALLAVLFVLLLKLDQFFFGHLIILARREHRAFAVVPGISIFTLALFEGGKISHAANRLSQSPGLDEKFAYFFQEIVEVIRLQRVRKAFLLKDWLRVFRCE